MGQSSSNHSRTGRIPPAKSALIENAKLSEEKLPDGFKLLHGRGFKETGSPVYMLPNDGSEADRLNGQHYQFRYLMQGNYHVPLTEELEKGIKVIDVGCGTGIWTVEMAEQFPASHFTATDITDIYKNPTKIPSNCTFLQVDTRDGLPFEDNTFDYVFQRHSSICFPVDTWPIVLKELVRVAKPGAHIELVECAQILHDAGPSTARWAEHLFRTLMMRGVNARYVASMESALEAAGMVDIYHDYQSAPVGWGPNAELGRLLKLNIMESIKGFRPQMTIALGIDDNEYDRFIENSEAELGTTHKTYFNIEMYTARKPA
ncbi:S-adenosyl-L-methionine-dependent methyltransferase [Jimgerdemannia flammicorona]|uniref:Uncharacterized protein n=2 Tax=Jimgerdemannia flammicorona TaxID=994334 RepID=A0A433QEF2_9FUNG|nr:S-adenosyl-L-methionine-dependent methyltransferase [Jimgerdemannia flammicorona]RUS28190.1 hypothetical protein BC938DRAFT_482190 [Jimgerdemannia flammicorona]